MRSKTGYRARSVAFALVGLIWCAPVSLRAQAAQADPCHNLSAGAAVPEPEDLRSRNGELTVDLRIDNYLGPDGSPRYCYTTPDGHASPTLRLNPGDLLILNLKNGLTVPAAAAPGHHAHGKAVTDDPCTSGLMTATSTNLHFHGLTIPPVCHQDDVVHTSIQPGDKPFQYRFRIPANQPPGLYWYHPHIHGFSKVQVLGGASGALIVEGIERANPELAGMPERVLVIRDRDLLNPDAPPSKSEPVTPKNLIDRDGDCRQTLTAWASASRPKIFPSTSCRCLIPITHPPRSP